MPMTDDDFMTMGAPQAQTQADASAPKVMSDDDFMNAKPAAAPMPTAAPQKPSELADVGKTLAGNVAPNAAANLAAGAISAPATAISYGTQLATKAGEYLTEDAMNAYRRTQGLPPISPEEFASEQKDFKNAIRQKFGLQPTDESGDISDYVPTPSGVLSGAAKAVGTPLYQPQTGVGQAVETLGNIASGGVGSGAKTATAALGAMAATAAQQGAKAAGGGDQAQFWAGLAGGAGGGMAGEKSMPALDNLAKSQNGGESAGLLQDSADMPALRQPKTTSQDLRDRAKPYYDYSKDQGVNFTPQATSDLISQIKSDWGQTGKMNANIHGDSLSVLNDLKNDVDNGNLDLETLHQNRQLFRDAVNKNTNIDGTQNPDGMKSVQAIDAIDNFLDKAKDSPDMLTNGSPDAIDAWQKGQQLWAASSRARDLEMLQQRADFRQNPSTSMRDYLGSIAGNPKKMNRFDPEQQALIKDGARTDLSQEALRAIGSRLMTHVAGGIGASVGAGMGGPFGAMTGAMLGEGVAMPIGMAARGISASMQRGKIQNIIDNITNKAPGEFQAPPAKAAAPAPLQIGNQINMPPPETPAPAAAQPAPETPRGPLALPSPKEMTYEDMARTGRILQSPDKMPINMTNGAPATTYNPLDMNRGDEGQFANAKNMGIDLANTKKSQVQKTLDLQSQHEKNTDAVSALAQKAGISSIIKDRDVNGGKNDNDQGTPNARQKAVNEGNEVGERQQASSGFTGSGSKNGAIGQGVSGSPPSGQGLVDAAALHANTEPTEAQKSAGNYQKGHVNIQGLNVSIENPADTVRKGVGPEGPWETTMPAHYGYIRKTMGADGDHVDPNSSPKDRPFARQKAALLPIEHSMTGDPNLDAPMQKLARSLTAEQRKGSLGKTTKTGD